MVKALLTCPGTDHLVPVEVGKMVDTISIVAIGKAGGM